MEATLTDTAQITRATSSVDAYGAGGGAQGAATEYPCRVVNNPAFPNNILLGDQDAVRAQWEVLLPLSADVRDIDTITVGDNKFKVLDTDKGRTNSLLVTARCRKDV